MTIAESRVASVAEALLAERRFVTPIDVLMGLGWVAKPSVDYWLRGSVPFFDHLIHKDRTLLGAALDELAAWARARDLQPWDTDYGDRTFIEGGDPVLDRSFRTRWAFADKPAPRIPRPRPRERKVVAAETTWECGTCGVSGGLILKAKSGGICLDCAGLGHLVFLPAGDAALTRRARKASPQSAVVVRNNRTRQRFERQGILAGNAAIEFAALQCRDEADPDARGERETFRDDIAAVIRTQFPGCPVARADAIAYHHALRFSGRAGRGDSERALAPETIRAAVTGSVRHVDTDYDELLKSGVAQADAGRRVTGRIHDILRTWSEGAVTLD
jgi:hypothetical protein